jgi:hypothetical protein
VSLGFLSSYFQVSLSLRIGILSSREGVALVLRRAQLNLTKLTAMGKLFSIVPKIYGLVYLHGSELTAAFLFRLFVTRLKRTRRPGPNERSVHYVSCARLLETLDDAFYPPLFISFNSYTEF